MDPSACRVIYIDDRFNTERWISRDAVAAANSSQRGTSAGALENLPRDLQANINAFLSVFNQVYVCRSGRAFSTKLSEIHDKVRPDCTPILACFDVGSQKKHDPSARPRPHTSTEQDSLFDVPKMLKRELTFSSEADESYGLQLLSRIASDLQVEEGVKLIIPVAVVQPQRRDSYDHSLQQRYQQNNANRGSQQPLAPGADSSDIIDPQLMLQCLDAGALDVVKSPLDKAGIMGLTVHAYRIYKSAKAEQAHPMSRARGRKQSWVGIDEEKPYAYLREAMVRKLLKGICEPEVFIEDYQHRDLYVEQQRKRAISEAVGRWDFSAQDFSEDELVYAGYYILNHALSMKELSKWHMPEADLVRFMQGCRVAYNHFVLYHNFKHAVDVLQSTFYFLVQIGILPPYPVGSEAPKHSNDKSPVAKLVGPFEAMTLLISAIGHDVGHPGVNNMFLVKLNAPLAQLYNDTSVLEAFHCAAYSQILRRHWPTVFHDKAIRKLMISSILATDMGCHSDYMHQLGNLQTKIHHSKTTDSWTPKDIETFRVLTCGLLIKCADISNVARPWAVAEKWTYKLQDEFAHQGEMEKNIGMETTLFGGPPEIGNMLKLANGQIGFMTIFAHPLFANVADVIPAMSFAAEEILVNKGVWFTRAEHEKNVKLVTKLGGVRDGGVSPRSRSPVGEHKKNSFAASPLREKLNAEKDRQDQAELSTNKASGEQPRGATDSQSSSLKEVQGLATARDKPESYTPPMVDASSSDPSSVKARNEAKQVQANGVAERSDSQSATPTQRPVDQGQGTTFNPNAPQLSDPSRDQGVSMRAGSAAIPHEEMKNIPGIQKSLDAQDEFAKFKFATSDVNEPVREFDPKQQDYPKVSQNSRASAPMNDLMHQEEINKSAVTETPSRPDSEPAIGEVPHAVTTGDGRMTPTPSTEATSYTTDDKSEGAFSSPRTAEAQRIARERALSAPGQPNLIPSFSLNSDDSTSREGSKNDFRTTVFSNGDNASEERPNNRKFSTKSVGRRRSRLKMNLAFWKKKNTSDRSLDEDT